MVVAVVDYGAGNVQSVVNACSRLGQQTTVVRNGEELAASLPSHIILPGVGAVGASLTELRDRDLDIVMSDFVLKKGVYFLGICVGMQVMAEKCLEFGEHKGLGWFPGVVERIYSDEPIRLPHVGWNTLRVLDINDPVVGSLDGTDAYFVHSYAMVTLDQYVLATSNYGGNFVSAVRRGTMYGVQFHPEKSSELGQKLLTGFVSLK